MKLKRFILIVSIILLIGFVFLKIRDIVKKPKNVFESEEEIARILYEKNLEKETVTLLSMKYNLMPETISGIFIDYCDFTGLNCDLFMSKDFGHAKLPIDQAIGKIIIKYDVTPEIVANLIIDERKMREVYDDCIIPNDIDDYHNEEDE